MLKKRTISKKELADIFNVSPRTVNRWVVEGCPKRVNISGKLFFSHKEVEKWGEKRGERINKRRNQKLNVHKEE